jgi:uncharacterized protein with FMN-binding domain
MGKTTRFLLAITLIALGTVVTAGHPAWNTSVRVAILLLLLGAAIAAGVLTYRCRSENSSVERKLSGQKLSTSLVTLSSGAILAVYAAGYHRTSSAADRLAQQTARRRMAGPIAASAVVPIEAPYRVEPSGTVPPPPTPNAPAIAKTAKAPTRNAAAPPLAVARNNQITEPTALPLSMESTNPQVAAVVLPTTVASMNTVTEPAAPPAVKAAVRYKDGSYLGWGSCRHGDIQASVVIEGGKIASVSIAQCLTRYSCSWISNLPGQVVARQSPEVDYVSGASQSTDAFYYAVVEALSKAHE